MAIGHLRGVTGNRRWCAVIVALGAAVAWACITGPASAQFVPTDPDALRRIMEQKQKQREAEQGDAAAQRDEPTSQAHKRGRESFLTAAGGVGYIDRMPRRPRNAMGGMVYHVLNRGVGRMQLFDDVADYAAFERVLAQAQQRDPTRLLGYCLMPNHWHLVIWPRRDDELSEWMRWVTVTHTQRWHAHRGSAGHGPIYQGRFKSLPVQSDEHFITLMRYVERNARRAKLVKRAEDWQWGSLWRWVNRRRKLPAEEVPALSDWPVVAGGRPHGWARLVNTPLTDADAERIEQSITRSRPFGGQQWTTRTAKNLGIESALRPIGRPRKNAT